ncbi:MAG: hypothetical protein ACUVT8_13195 [Armatimonadota bacterium]
MNEAFNQGAFVIVTDTVGAAVGRLVQDRVKVGLCRSGIVLI